MKKIVIIYVLLAGLFLQATISLAGSYHPGKPKKHKAHKERRKKDPAFH